MIIFRKKVSFEENKSMINQTTHVKQLVLKECLKSTRDHATRDTRDTRSCNGRRSRSQIFFQIDACKIFAIFTGKHLCESLFLIKFTKKDSDAGVIL